MKDLNKTLQKYTKAKEALDKHLQENKEVFDKHQEIVGSVMDAEQELREVTYIEQRNAENDRIRVTYSPAYKKYYDGDYIIKKVDKKTRENLFGEGALRYDVDKSKLEKMVEQGKVLPKILQEAYREEELKPRIRISEKVNKE